MTGDRKQYPVTTGVLHFFPDAIAEVARVSLVSTEQHHPGEAMHWDRDKSRDHLDALGRHLLKPHERDDDGLWHLAKVAWRGLAALQVWLEQQQALTTANKAMDSPAYPRNGCNGCDDCRCVSE